MKRHKKVFYKTLFTLYILFFITKTTFALPPPDFVMQVVSNIGIYLSLGLALIATVFGVAFQFIRVFILRYKYYIIIFFNIIIFISLYIYFIIPKDQVLSLDLYKNDYVGERGWFESGNNIDLESKIKNNKYVKDLEKKLGINKIIKSNKKIKNIELQKLLNNKSDFIILDAREDIENSLGKIPNSIHKRPADLVDGSWQDLPKEKLIVIACISGIRGKIVYDFLRSKGLVVRYLEDGVMGWVGFGGIFDGEHIFGNVYNDIHYNLLFSKEQLDEKILSGVKIIDSREPYKLNDTNRIKGALELSVMYTPSKMINKKFVDIKKGEEFVIVCDDWVNCFDAKLVGIELEKRGAKFYGFFNNPEYLYTK